MRKFYIPVLALVVLLAGIFIGQVQPAQKVDAQIGSGIGNFDIAGPVIVHGGVTVADGNDLTLTDDVAVTDDATVGDDATITGDLNANGILVTAAIVGNTAETTVTVTSGGTVTPLGRWVPLSAAGAVGTSSIAGCAAGDAYSEDIVLINMSSNTITFTDTGTLLLSGNSALGQNDVLILKCDNLHGNWIEIGEVNN